MSTICRCGSQRSASRTHNDQWPGRPPTRRPVVEVPSHLRPHRKWLLRNRMSYAEETVRKASMVDEMQRRVVPCPLVAACYSPCIDVARMCVACRSREATRRRHFRAMARDESREASGIRARMTDWPSSPHPSNYLFGVCFDRDEGRRAAGAGGMRRGDDGIGDGDGDTNGGTSRRRQRRSDRSTSRT